jgi:hypothetical protein
VFNQTSHNEEVQGSGNAVSTSAPAGGDQSDSWPSRLTPWEKAPGVSWTGGWGGRRAGLEAVMKRTLSALVRNGTPIPWSTRP